MRKAKDIPQSYLGSFIGFWYLDGMYFLKKKIHTTDSKRDKKSKHKSLEKSLILHLIVPFVWGITLSLPPLESYLKRLLSSFPAPSFILSSFIYLSMACSAPLLRALLASALIKSVASMLRLGEARLSLALR